MSKPQVTITLGRTGRKVVKRQTTAFDGARSDGAYQQISGSKRSMRERLDTYHADTSSIGKRLRWDASLPPGLNGVGQNDLRLKLMRKRLSREMQQEAEEKKVERRQTITRTIRSPERPEHENLRQIPVKRKGDGMVMMDPVRSYSSWASEGNPEPSNRGKAIVDIDEIRTMSAPRSSYGPRDNRLGGGDVREPSRSTHPTTINMGRPLNTDNRVSELFPPSGSAAGNSYMGEPPQTVAGLLHSLGLGKYAVQFQVEEVDMTVLRQMGENDLKELGIPMGPRKKILLAVLPSKKRQLLPTTN